MKKIIKSTIINDKNQKRKRKNTREKHYDLNKKRRKQIESSKEIKQNERKQKREIMVDEDIDLGSFFELALSNKIYVNKLNLHEIKNENLLDYTGDFEGNGSMPIRPVEHKTKIRYKNMDDFECYINAIYIAYDSGDVTSSGYVYKLNTPQFNVVKRSGCAKSTN